MKSILILCTGNSTRSQMAHGYLQYMAGDKANVYSAGVEVHGLNPKAVAIMAEDGIDIAHHTSNHVDEYSAILFDYVITVCDHANERCPLFPGSAVRFHHNFEDPSKALGAPEAVLATYRRVRDQIKAFCQDWVSSQLSLSAIRLTVAQPQHVTAVVELLGQANLPTDDLPGDLEGFVLAFDGTTLVGSAGVQTVGDVGLLRSVAVRAEYQGKQLGQQLTKAALQKAQESGLQSVYLITTTADRYFERYGFVRIDRDQVPPEITSTEQFSNLCPSSAVVMRRV